MIITVDTDKLVQLAGEGENILLTQDAENALVELLELSETVSKAVDAARHNIEAKAKEINPNFQKIVSDRLRITYRSYGSRYVIDPTHVQTLPKELYNMSVKYNANAKAIDELFDRTGKLPLGIAEPDRPKSVHITLKGKTE